MSDRINDIVSDIQYILQAVTELQDRVTKVEDFVSEQGKDQIFFCPNKDQIVFWLTSVTNIMIPSPT